MASHANGPGKITMWALGIIGTLVVASIIGLAKMAGTQVAQSANMITLKAEQERQRVIVNHVDVIQGDVATLKEEVKGIRADMKTDHKEVMDAIKEIE